jgi:hypothetical protein
MRKLITALAFAAALTALPAAAHAEHDERGYGWDGPSGYSMFERDFRRAREAIRYGRRNGDFTRYDAETFRIELDRIRERLDFYGYNDGYLSRWEIGDVRRRFDRLYGLMRHEARQGYDDWRDYR